MKYMITIIPLLNEKFKIIKIGLYQGGFKTFLRNVNKLNVCNLRVMHLFHNM